MVGGAVATLQFGFGGAMHLLLTGIDSVIFDLLKRGGARFYHHVMLGVWWLESM